MKQRVILFGIFLLNSLFLCCQSEKCQFRSIKRMDTIKMINGDNISYGHRLLVKEFPESCFDSLTCMRLMHAYLDTVSVDKPVHVISFHNSGEWFYHPSIWINDAREDGSLIDDILVSVYLLEDEEYEFVFYEDGEMSYKGPNWNH